MWSLVPQVLLVRFRTDTTQTAVLEPSTRAQQRSLRGRRHQRAPMMSTEPFPSRKPREHRDANTTTAMVTYYECSSVHTLRFVCFALFRVSIALSLSLDEPWHPNDAIFTHYFIMCYVFECWGRQMRPSYTIEVLSVVIYVSNFTSKTC